MLVARDKARQDDSSLEGATQGWTGYLNGTHTPKFGKPPRIIYLAFAGETLVGNVACHHTTKQGFEAELQSIYVHPDYQGQGLGTALLRMAVDRLLAAGIASMMVGFYSDNPFQRFYVKYGGQLTASHRCEWSDLNALRHLLD